MLFVTMPIELGPWHLHFITLTGCALVKRLAKDQKEQLNTLIL